MSNDPKITQKMLLASLTRMKTEYIDHYMIHWPDTDVDIRFPLEVLAKNQLEGKIKSIGLCNTNYDDLEKALEVVEISSVQMQNNLFERPSERVISFLEEKRIPFVGWGVFDKGIISARVDKKRELSKNYEEGDSRKKSVWWKQADVLNKIEKIEKLKPMLRFHELSLIEAAINYAFAPKWADHILIGSKTIKDWEQVLDVSRREIASEILLEMEAICHS
jgi:aryl-alcohol dehydrogenase-like predicted oxidoreductase